MQQNVKLSSSLKLRRCSTARGNTLITNWAIRRQSCALAYCLHFSLPHLFLSLHQLYKERHHTYPHNRCFCLCVGGEERRRKKAVKRQDVDLMLLRSNTDVVLSPQGRSKDIVLERPHDAFSLMTRSWLEHTKAARSLSPHAHNSPV